MAISGPSRDILPVIRYYLTGLLNTAFGYGLFALLVWYAIDIFVAQLISHCLGVAFNYFTFSRFTFAGRAGSKWRFILSYAGNYFCSLAILFVISSQLASPYLSGLLTVLIVSALNYFVLNSLVFRRRAEA